MAIAKVAAASLDDVASQAADAGLKAAGVVIDDAAVRHKHNRKSRQHISISSSVRPSSVRGTVTSNALATLISNSIFGSLVSVAKLFLDH